MDSAFRSLSRQQRHAETNHQTYTTCKLPNGKACEYEEGELVAFPSYRCAVANESLHFYLLATDILLARQGWSRPEPEDSKCNDHTQREDFDGNQGPPCPSLYREEVTW